MRSEVFYTCIYCRENKLLKAFNREHVLQDSFGQYKNALVLDDKVCSACNQKFGDTIDASLARGTLEGIERFNRGIKPTREIKNFRNSKHAKNQTRIATSGFLKGIELELSSNKNSNGLECRTKNADVAFRQEDGRYDFYRIDQLLTKEEINQKYPLHDDRIKIVNVDNAEKISQVLSQRLDISDFVLDEEISKVDNGVNCDYTNNVFRAVAKSAFNYLAYFNATSLLLQNCFDPIREFICNGTGRREDFVDIIPKPILNKEDEKAYSLHFLTINDISEKSILSSVSFFSMIHYGVCLTSNYDGEPIETGYGHCFCPHEHKIGELGKIDN